MSTPDPTQQESLIEYPSQFPIKVMGVKADGYVHAITQIAEQFDPAFDASTIELRPSKAGNYLGVTITVTATSRQPRPAFRRVAENSVDVARGLRRRRPEHVRGRGFVHETRPQHRLVDAGGAQPLEKEARSAGSDSVITDVFARMRNAPLRPSA